MKHQRHFGTLLAVTLATAAPASASPDRAAAPPARPTMPFAPAPAPSPAPTPPAGPAAPSFVQQIVSSLASLARTAARPRELPCGAPACGNVMSRIGPRPPRSE